MNKEPVSRKDLRDQEMADFLTKLEISKIEEKEKADLVERFDNLVDTIFTADEDETYKLFVKNQERKRFYQFLFAFIVGVVVALIPSIIIMNNHNSNAHNEVVEFQFVPNALGYWKPTYVQSIKTQEQLESVKHSNIRDKQYATIGAVVRLGKIGLTIIPADELKNPHYHLKDVGPQKDKEKVIGRYSFIPDTLFTMDPVNMQILKRDIEVESAKRVKNLLTKDLLEIGGGILCPEGAACFAEAKTTLENEYEKVVPIAN